jgi:hypothetical protein
VEHPVEFDANVSAFKADNIQNVKFVKFLTFGPIPKSYAKIENMRLKP